MSSGAKPTNAEIDVRISMIYKLVLKGWTFRKILSYVAQKTDWDICRRTLQNYINAAEKEIKKFALQQMKNSLEKAVLRYNDIYDKQMTEMDYSGARQTQAQIDKLLGNEAPKKLDHTTNGNELKGFTVVITDDDGNEREI